MEGSFEGGKFDPRSRPLTRPDREYLVMQQLSFFLPFLFLISCLPRLKMAGDSELTSWLWASTIKNFYNSKYCKLETKLGAYPKSAVS